MVDNALDAIRHDFPGDLAHYGLAHLGDDSAHDLIKLFRALVDLLLEGLEHLDLGRGRDAVANDHVAVQVDDAVDGLERAAAAAPDEANRALCMRCADSLRGLAFAVEADHLMRSGGQTPTGEQLASADSARRNRSAELNRALEDLKLAIAPKK